MSNKKDCGCYREREKESRESAERQKVLLTVHLYKSAATQKENN
jgi:hypothetical protein